MNLRIAVCHLFVFLSLTVHAIEVPDIPENQRVFHMIDAANGLADNSAEVVMATLSGRMVISSIGHINFYDGTVFSHIGTERENIYTLKKYTGNYRMYFDRHHHLWLKNHGAVSCVNLSTERFVVNVDSVFKSFGVNGEVEDLFADAQSNCWLATGSKLYSVERKRYYPLDSSKHLQDLGIYNDDQLLLFYADGEVQVLDLGTGKLKYRKYAYPEEKRKVYNKSTFVLPSTDGFYQLRNGASSSILLFFNMKSRSWQTLMELPYQMRQITLHNNLLYVATSQGYWTFNIHTGAKEHIESVQLDNGRTMSFPVNTICFDRQQGMWIGTGKRGLLYCKPFLPPFRKYSNDSQQGKEYLKLLARVKTHEGNLPRHINCEYKDSRGWKWTGTQTGLRLDKGDGSPIEVFNRSYGLLNDVVHAVIEDRNTHEIWVNTSFGITCFQVHEGEVDRIYIYGEDDNVTSESFVNEKVMQLPDGTILMQSLDDVIAFKPSRFQLRKDKSPFTLYPKLVRLLVNGDEMTAGQKHHGRVILEKAVSRTREFAVNYDQNSLMMVFSGLNYFRPLHTFYRVRINSTDERDWKEYSYFTSKQVDKKGLLHLALTGLRPGVYTIEVQASLSPEDWNFAPCVLKIKVEQPWWRSTGVFLLLLLLVGAVVILNLVIYFRNAALRLRKNQEEAIFIRRILSFVDRCDQYSSELLAPRFDNHTEEVDERVELSDEFVKTMTLLVPYIREHRSEELKMQMLSEISQKDIHYLYKLINDNIYRSPRLLAISLRLQRAKNLLKNTEVSLEEVAMNCGFVSPNFFISSFYHTFQMTPQEYRQHLS